MSQPNLKIQKSELQSILSFIDNSKGLRAKILSDHRVQILQDADQKVFFFGPSDLNEILHRKDNEQKPFIQLNFVNSNKVLLTDALIGFKPADTFGLDLNRIPKVVTTPDLSSVSDAIEESLGSETHEHEVEILKKVYLSILNGAERVGFHLPEERKWIQRLVFGSFRASA